MPQLPKLPSRAGVLPACCAAFATGRARRHRHVSVQFENRVSRMLGRDFAPCDTSDISYADQQLMAGFAKRLGVPLLLANLTHQVYQMARAAGLDKEDGPAIVKVL
jgi:3-hydroxyisobutyrate dehydrogenase-like beta-hydroxyacid dehydrogenase